jgi:hypothetical protein
LVVIVAEHGGPPNEVQFDPSTVMHIAMADPPVPPPPPDGQVNGIEAWVQTKMKPVTPVEAEGSVVTTPTLFTCAKLASDSRRSTSMSFMEV